MKDSEKKYLVIWGQQGWEVFCIKTQEVLAISFSRAAAYKYIETLEFD